MTSLTPVPGGLELEFPFNRELVDQIKTLPSGDRKWDAARRRWIIAHEQAPVVCRMVKECLGVVLPIPQAGTSAAAEIRALRVEYIGRTKARNADDPPALRNASGYLSPGDRCLVFPEPVLRAWFLSEPEDQPVKVKPGMPATFYQILMVTAGATGDDIKKAHRRLAMQLHPDRNREADASEQFQRLQHAYEVLRDDRLRRKYDAGLKLEASTKADDFRPFGRPKNMTVNRHDDDAFGYRSPLRCGNLVIAGAPRVGQFLVSKILAWEDIIDDQGRTLVSSWALGEDSYSARWF